MNKGLMKGLITAGFLFIITFAAILSINYIIPAFAATLSSTNVQPLSLFAGTNGTIDVNFITVSSIPADGIIKITLPSSFSVGGPAWCNLTGSFSTSISGNTTTITRSGGTATDAVTPVWCTINSTVNPRVSGSTGNYIIRTQDAGEADIDTDKTVSADTIVAGNLSSVNVQPLNPAAGANTSVDVNFTTANEIPANGRIAVTFGSGFALGGSFGWCNVSGSFASSVSGQKIIITRSGGDATLNVTPIWCTVNATINPRTSGSTGIYTVNTTTNANVLIDTLDVAADTLVGGNLTSSNVQPTSLNANANTSVDVSFTTANEIPANGKINVVFGSSFSVGGPASCNITGTFATSISGQVLTITRSADGGATFNVTPVSCVINNTRNPTTTGSTGVYSINSTTTSNVLIDTLTVAADTIVQGYGGALTSTNVQPLNLQAGTNNTVDVNFTLANPIPNNASINVTFGSSFSVGGPASCDITGTFNTTITGQTVVIRRNADGSETAANTAISCKINNTKNANITGSTGTYTIATSSISDSFNLTIDSLTNVDLDTITAGNLTLVNVQPLSLVAGANGTIDVNFTVTNPIPPSGRVSIAFGSGFSVGGPAWCNFTGSNTILNTTISGQRIIIQISANGTVVNASQPVWCTVNNTVNPRTSGSTGIYTVNTSNADAVLIDTLDVTADTITSGALSSTNVQPISLVAGANTTVDVNFTTANSIPSDGKITVVFGSSFSVGGPVWCNETGSYSGSYSGTTVTITRSGGSATVNASLVWCTVNNTRNPQTTGSTGTYNITTKTSADAVIDTSAAVTADTVTAGALTSTNVQPLTLNANANTTVDANFTLANPLPANATINVTFPSNFKVGGPASCNVAGTFNTSISGQTIIITRNADGSQTAATTAVSCRINNTKNPASTGSTGTYTITTLLSSTSLNQTIDTDAAVTADTIAQGTGGTLTLTNVQPLSLVAGANGTVDINFTTTNPIPADGKIKILFPSGFSLQNIDVVSALWCGSMDGSFAVSRSNQLITLARSGGTEQAGGSAESCKINATVNPRVSGSAGAYRITITDASDALIDNDSSVTADTIVGGNLTSSNVQPTSLNANANTSVDVNFTTANEIPANGKINVVFGSSFSIGGPASCNLTGTYATAISGQVLTITRSSGSATLNITPVSCVINNTRNPLSTGSTGVYSINSTTSSDVLIDTVSVAADTVVQGYGGALTSTNVQPLSLVAGANTTIDVNFTIANTLPANATINITFGSGFSAGGPGTCNSMDGTFNTTIAGQTVILTRNADGTEQAAGSAESCRINATRNPVTSGSAGTYTITTLLSSDSLNQTIDTASVTADTITAGALTSSNVQPISLVAGANTTISSNVTVDINFTAPNPIPSDGKIVVTFGSGFSVGGPGNCNGLDGVFATSISGQVVTLTRSTGTATPVTTAVNCTLNNTVNPRVSGSTGTYNITTKTSADAVIDTDAVVSADTITAGVLSSSNVQPISLVAGANTTVDVNFTTANSIPSDGKINVVFGSSFSIGGPASCNLTGTYATAISGQVLTITRSSGSATLNITPVSCVINNTLNPRLSGSAGTYNITITTSADVVIDTDAAVTADTITAGALSSTNAQPLSLVAGANGTVDANFTLANPLPANATINITFGSGFSVGGPASCNVSGTFNTSISGQTLIITRNADGSQIAVSTAMSCRINNTKNPVTTGTTGTYIITTLLSSTSLNQTIDTDAAVGADTIIAGNLTTVNIQPISLTAGANTTVDVNFTLANPLPTGGIVSVTFGSGFSIGGRASCNVSGTFNTSIAGQRLIITRNAEGSQIGAGNPMSCVINNTVNPRTSGSTGIYTVNTSTNADVLIDTLDVAADTLVGGNLTSSNVQPTSLNANANTSVDVNFTTANEIPANGKINVVFGSSFSIGGPASCNLTGTYATAISGQVLTITRSSGSATLNITPVSCVINNTRNPLSTGSTGIYTVNTTSSSDVLIDTLTVAADTVVQGYGGSLSSTNAQPLSLATGTNTTIDVNFTIANTLPANATINVTFGSGFSVGGPGTCNSMDGTFNTTISGQTIILTRNADGTEQAGNSAESCKINGTLNPRTTGTTGTYIITTLLSSTSLNQTIDTDAAVGADTITQGYGGSLSSTNAQPLSLATGANITVDVNFTTYNPIPVNATINVTFGAGFALGGVNTPSALWCGSMDGTFNVSVSGQTVILTRNADGTEQAGNSAESCKINGTLNPRTTGTTGTYGIRTILSNILIDSADSVTADTVVQGYGGALSSINTQPLSLQAGANGTVDVNFTTYNPIPANATINVTFGSGFSVGGPGTCNSMDGTFNTTISGQTVILTRNADGTEQAGNSAESCKINGTLNPRTTGTTGTYIITTLLSSTSLNQTIDTDAAVGADTITAGNLTSVNAQPLNLATGANTTVDVNFTLANPWPAGGKVSVLFGGSFNVSGVQGASCNVSGTFNTTIALQRVIITRNADGVQWNASAPVSCKVNNTVNPLLTGSTGIYIVNTSTNADVLIDTLDVAADTITQGTGGALSSVNVQPLSLIAGANTTIDVNFTTVNPISTNATINVTFGSGFTLGGVVTTAALWCGSMDGTFNVSVSGQTVILTRNADGTAQAGNSAESCKINGTINPTAAVSTGTYTIKTIISDILIDNATATADTITANSAIKLKIYVASSVLTNESATVTVWAQDTYGNNATSSSWITYGSNSPYVGWADLPPKRLVSGSFSTVMQGSRAETVTLNASEDYGSGTETLNSTTATVTFTLADIVAPSINGTSPTTADSITSSSVAMYVNTTEAATCKFDNSDVSYAAMANTMTGTSTTHNFTLSSLSNGAKAYYARCQDTTGNTMTTSTSISFIVSLDVTPSIVIAVGPSGTIANSRPELLVNTSESATCKFDNSTKDYSSMTYTMTGTGATHNFTLWSLLDSDKTFAVRCQDTTGNAMNVSESITFTVDTRSNFNLTIPRGFGSNGYFTFRNNNNGWNSFQLVQNMDLNNTGLANYNVTNVLASVNGNYSKIYAYDGSTWKVYVPGTAGNTFTVFSSNATGENYYINMTVANERIEIN